MFSLQWPCDVLTPSIGTHRGHVNSTISVNLSLAVSFYPFWAIIGALTEPLTALLNPSPYWRSQNPGTVWYVSSSKQYPNNCNCVPVAENTTSPPHMPFVKHILGNNANQTDSEIHNTRLAYLPTCSHVRWSLCAVNRDLVAEIEPTAQFDRAVWIFFTRWLLLAADE